MASSSQVISEYGKKNIFARETPPQLVETIRAIQRKLKNKWTLDFYVHTSQLDKLSQVFLDLKLSFKTGDYKMYLANLTYIQLNYSAFAWQ